MGALDGLRGLALIGVVLFHQGFAWAHGFFVSLPVFFALSGFLITTLLVAEHDAHGRVDVSRFATRRVRRLAPLSLITVVLVALAWMVFHDERLARSIHADAIASLLQVANWWFIVDQKSYAELFSSPTPYLHFWSLALEVQLYILWPVVLLFLLRRVASPSRRLAVAIALFTASALSTLLMPSFDLIYYGTHVRAAEFLAGAVLALWLADRRATTGDDASRLPPWSAWLALAALTTAAVVGRTGQWLWSHGGLALMGAAAAVLIGGALCGGALGRVLSIRPLQIVGVWSYGLYLVHWPVFVLLTAERTGLPGWAVFPARLLVTVAIAVVLGRLVEQPVRERTLLRSTPALLAGCLAVGALAVVVAQATVSRETEPSFVAGGSDEGPQVFMRPTDTESDAGAGASPGEPISGAPEASAPEGGAAAADSRTTRVASSSPPPVQRRVRLIGSTANGALSADVVAAARRLGIEIDDRRRDDCPIVPAAEVFDYGEHHITSMCPEQSTLVTPVTAGVPIDAYIVTVGRPDLATYRMEVGGPIESTLASQGFLSRRLPVLARSLRADGLPVLIVPDEGLDATARDLAWSLMEPLDADDPGIHVGGPLSTAAGRSRLLDVLGLDAPSATTPDAPDAGGSEEPAGDDGPVVLVLGDSTGVSLARFLYEESGGAVQSMSLSQDGCPLIAVDDIRWWDGAEFSGETCPTVDDIAAYVHQYQPDVVLMVSSLMEQSELRVDGGDWFVAGDSEFRQRHEEYMDAVMQAVADAGSVVLVFDAPPLGDGAFRDSAMGDADRIAAWNDEIDRWDAAWENVVRVGWTQWIAQAEAAHGEIRDDAVHVDEEPLREIVRTDVLPLLDGLEMLRDRLREIGCLTDDGRTLQLERCRST